VSLLRTGDTLKADYSDGALDVTVPLSLRTPYPDIVKIEMDRKITED
jgi:hypothetical protein